MDEWKKKIDEEEARRRADQQARNQKASEEWSRQVSERIAQERREYEQKLVVHKQQFKCRICGHSSDGPVVFNETTSIYNGDHYVGEQSTGRSETYWNQPTGLYQCQKCNQWVCDTHYYKGICMNCAQGH